MSGQHAKNKVWLKDSEERNLHQRQQSSKSTGECHSIRTEKNIISFRGKKGLRTEKTHAPERRKLLIAISTTRQRVNQRTAQRKGGNIAHQTLSKKLMRPLISGNIKSSREKIPERMSVHESPNPPRFESSEEREPPLRLTQSASNRATSRDRRPQREKFPTQRPACPWGKSWTKESSRGGLPNASYKEHHHKPSNTISSARNSPKP